MKLTGWYYLSFADEVDGKDTWLGAAVVRGGSLHEAVTNAHVQGCNPGGQVFGHPIPDMPDVVMPPEEMRGRLLTRADIETFWPETVKLKDIPEEDRVALGLADLACEDCNEERRKS